MKNIAEGFPVDGMETAPDSRKKRAYFEAFALRHLPEMRLLFRGGKLWQKDEWRNVAEHCIVQGVAIDVLTEALRWNDDQRKRAVTAALSHDWAKRLQIRGSKDFTPEEEEHAKQFLDKVSPDQDLIAATGPEFIRKALIEESASLPELTQFYVDDIARGSEIVRFLDRIAEVRERQKKLDEDPEMTARLGGKYWDREIELGQMTEQKIFNALRENGVALGSPEEIPDFINLEIKKRIEGTV
jgi:hypothetical protein